jgi:hypothetical protein
MRSKIIDKKIALDILEGLLMEPEDAPIDNEQPIRRKTRRYKMRPSYYERLKEDKIYTKEEKAIIKRRYAK